MSAAALLASNPNPSDADINAAMAGNSAGGWRDCALEIRQTSTENADPADRLFSRRLVCVSRSLDCLCGLGPVSEQPRARGVTIHCVAGDATGIILAAAITAGLGLPMWIDLIVEYVTGFAFGLFIFQSLFMKSMMGGTYWQNVRKTFLPELTSMNFMMAGMAPVMSFLMMGRDMRAMEPIELVFWGVMSLGVIAGFAMAYPANAWMVVKHLKHELMTERKPGGRFDVQNKSWEDAEEKRGAHASHGHHVRRHGERAQIGGHTMKSDATRAQLAAVAGVSSLTLALGMVAPANWVNLGLSARDVGGAIMPPGMIMDRDTAAEAMTTWPP